MQINNIKAGHNKNISYKGAGMQLVQKMADPTRHALRTLSDLDALATTVVLEGFVTGGRGINAYKRGGKNEFRERFTDDVVSAVFWMKGVDIFNKIGDYIGRNILKLPTTEFDVGKDALRTPFENLRAQNVNNLVKAKLKENSQKKAADLVKDVKNSKAIDALSKKIAAFKFTKIVTSSILATAFVGFALPKINQAITERIMGRNKMEKKLAVKGSSIGDDIMNSYSFEAFDKKFTSNNQAPSFKGLERAAHILENNRIAKLLTSDVGIITGRVTTARNKDEAREYFFRDSLSPFFYYASTPLTYMGLQKLTKSAGITGIDPVAAKTVNQTLTGLIEKSGPMSVKDFAQKTLGILDDKSKEILSNIHFESDVTSLKEFCKQVTDKELRKQAAQMSKLQPLQAGVGRVLTKQQVTDVLQKGEIHTPEFMNGIYKEKFGKALTDKLKFIPMKKITSFHNDIENYTQAVIKAAEKTNNGIVDKNILQAVNRKGLLMSAGFRTVAIGISALALGFIIPKMQYAMTARRTGSNAAPGLRNYEEVQKN